MKVSEQTQEPGEPGRRYRKPSERAARVVMNIVAWVKDIWSSTTVTTPRGQVFEHVGRPPAGNKNIRFSRILLVEDNPIAAQQFVEAMRSHYVFGTVRIFVAYAHEAAVTYFDNEDIDLVIMDADLDDEAGDGAALTRKFLAARPDVPILANSSSRISNLKLTGFGVVDTLGKNTEKLAGWLLANDPAGGGPLKKDR